MGNCLRLGIARIGLAINRCTSKKKAKQKSDTVILILGLEKAGKTTLASLISKSKSSSVTDTSTYVPTNGFSVYEVKSKKVTTKLYDLGGSESIRELWKHYYADAHGFIYVIDAASGEEEIQQSASVLAQVLQDERVKGKPILILANKQDIEGALSELELTSQMDIVRMVNTAKCLTRLDMGSASNLNQPDGPESGILHGFRWLTSYIKWHWGELNERVEHDSMEERSREQAKFERNREHVEPEPDPSPPKKERKESVDCSIKSYKGLPNHTLPAHRLDPEGGNDEEEEELAAKSAASVHMNDDGDASSGDLDMDKMSGFRNQVPEILIVEAKAQVHKMDESSSVEGDEQSAGTQLLEVPPSPILETKDSFESDSVTSIRDQNNVLKERSDSAQEATSPPRLPSGETAKSAPGPRIGPPLPSRRRKLFKNNRTAPILDPSLIPPPAAFSNNHNHKTG